MIVEVRAVDLADPGARDALCAELSERNISILCNNAGTATFGPIRGLDPAGERKQVQLNAVAVHDLTLAVLPGMLARGAGGILISGSAAGNSPIPNNATYAATKAFANTFSESLRGELKGTGVHVTLLAPGPCAPSNPTPRRPRSWTRWYPISCGSMANTPHASPWMHWNATRCAWSPASHPRPCR
ncbi:short chain dehydrogenase family protein [Mycobacteroides abscessus subsp. bolletii 1513]|uniref:NADP-dependent 3-hydroxy acid dehydrogenase YdfG n=1 Tax=Mycobacteroides abscessus subsp. bolletii 1513 TaxID=1299321 RepID=X8DSK7_9MYCO|nr:short chain dehydrogenase family protein [Mycobacteroides abscessus subsp. bolletii 1513]